VYGAYYRRLSKKVQAALAGANAVAEETLSAMATVRAHAAQDGARAAYSAKLDVFYGLQAGGTRGALACVRGRRGRRGGSGSGRNTRLGLTARQARGRERAHPALTCARPGCRTACTQHCNLP
jgi:ABC-type multidrug transport system fused ATPase/permease subunit